MTARSGLIQNIMTSTPITVKKARDELGQALLERLGDVVDVVGDPAQDVAARLAVEVGEREAAELHVDAPAEAVDGPLGDAGHDVGLGPAEDRARDVDPDRDEEDGAQRAEVDALARHDVHAREHVGEVVLAAAPAGPRRPAPGSSPAGSCLPTTPSKMMFVALPRILGPMIAKRTLTIAKPMTSTMSSRSGAQLAEQAPEGAPEVARLRGRHRGEAHGPATGAARAAPRAEAVRRPARGPCPARSRDLLLGELREDDLAVGRARGHELRVGADPDDAAVVEHDDPVGVDDRAHPLGDDDDGRLRELVRRGRPGVGRRSGSRGPRSCRRRCRPGAASRGRGRWPAAGAGRPRRSCRPA